MSLLVSLSIHSLHYPEFYSLPQLQQWFCTDLKKMTIREFYLDPQFLCSTSQYSHSSLQWSPQHGTLQCTSAQSNPSSWFWHIPDCYDPVTVRLKDHRSFQPDRPFRVRILVFQNMLKNMSIKLYWIHIVSVCYLANHISHLTTARFLTLYIWRVWFSVFIHKWGPSTPMIQVLLPRLYLDHLS